MDLFYDDYGSLYFFSFYNTSDECHYDSDIEKKQLQSSQDYKKESLSQQQQQTKEDNVSIVNYSSISSSNMNIVDRISTYMKYLLPRRIYEPTGPVMLLFDMLLSLFVGRGACRSMIDQLPLEVVGQIDLVNQLIDEPSKNHQPDNVQKSIIPVAQNDTCAICLGNYEKGEHVRHLRCMHAFHAECVDDWLERRSLCPVCKIDPC